MQWGRKCANIILSLALLRIKLRNLQVMRFSYHKILRIPIPFMNPEILSACILGAAAAPTDRDSEIAAWIAAVNDDRVIFVQSQEKPGDAIT
jgi:hypothetical protein